MVDVHDSETRSYNMSQIKAKDTKPELIVRKYLHKKGFRFRLHSNKLPGKPDIILPKFKTIIFINGCFWHGHDGCNKFVVPRTRTEWWLNKINKTKKRDAQVSQELKQMGWKVIIIWECELKSNADEQLFKLTEEIARIND
jgi:DNA mismatch endonuclease, patch repair protein